MSALGGKADIARTRPDVCFDLIELYQQMMESHLACETWDGELVRRMLAVRQNCLLLIEAAMPVPVAPPLPEIEPAVH